MAADARPSGGLRELARQFLRLGVTTVGGPAAHVAMFRHEFVDRRRWLGDREFLDLLAASNLIPGPTSTELAMHLGHRRAGWAGLGVAGVAFALPAAVLVTLLAWVYVTWGTLPVLGAVLAGIAPVVVAIVAHATVALGRSAVRGPTTGLITAAALIAGLAGVSEIVVLLAGGGLALLAAGLPMPGARSVPAALGLPVLGASGAAAAATVATPIGLFLTFLKIGSILFGSGYLLIALLRSELVVGAGLLTERQLLDAVAVGQLTPGPVFTTATFIGFVLLGLPGAVLATLGMALPAFGFVALSVLVLERLRSSPAARTALDGVGAAVVGLLIAVVAALAGTAFAGLLTSLVGVGAFGLLLGGRAGPVVLLVAGAVAGVVEHGLGWVLPT